MGLHPDAVARLYGPARGRDDPAPRSWCRQSTRAPGPPGSRGIDDDQGRGVGVPRAPAWISVGVPGAARAQIDDVSLGRLGAIGPRPGLVVDIQTTVACARVTHG